MRHFWTILLVLGLLLFLSSTGQAALTGIGIPGSVAGTYTDNMDGTHTLAGTGGNDLWGNADTFYMAYDQRALIGDGSVTAEVTSIPVSGGGWSRVGVQVRESLDQGSRHYTAALADISGWRGVNTHRPDTSGGTTRNADINDLGTHEWLRVVKSGTTFEAFHSDNGMDWSTIGGPQTENIVGARPMYIGLAAHGRGNNNTDVTTANFANLTITGFTELTSLTWDGSNNDWNTAAEDHWGAGVDVYPMASDIATINAGNVGVEANHEAYALEMGGGAVDIGAANRLGIGEWVNAAAGSVALGAASELSVGAGGGRIGKVAMNGNATIDVNLAEVTVPTLLANGNTLTKTGTGVLTLSANGTTDAGPVILNGGTVAFTPEIQMPESYTPKGTGLMGKWTFDDDTSNDTAPDGIPHNGTMVGGSYSTDTPTGTGKSADLSADGQYVIIDTFPDPDDAGPLLPGDEDDFDFTDQMTVSAWVKGWPNDGWEPFVSKNGEGAGYQVRRYGDTDRFSFTLRGTSGADDDPQGYSNTVAANTDEWHHVVATYDGVNKTHYVDGILDGIQADSGPITAGGAMVVFGARDNNNDELAAPNLGNFAQIRIDDVYIYNEALGADQMFSMDYSDVPITLKSDSTLAANGPVAASFGHLTLENGILTTAGSAPSISFDDTEVPAGKVAPGTIVGYDPQIPTNYGTIDLNGQEIFFAKGGTSTFTMDGTFTGSVTEKAAMTWAVTGGKLIVDASANLESDEAVPVPRPVKVIDGILEQQNAWTLGDSPLEVAGGKILFTGSQTGWQAGLVYGDVPGNMGWDPNPQWRVTYDMAETEDSIGGDTTEVYTGQFYDEDGSVQFTERIDDVTWMQIDGNVVLNDGDWNARTYADLALAADTWHQFELRISNGGGGAGPVGGEIGIGFDPTASSGSAYPASYVHLEDPGDASVLRAPAYETNADFSTHDLSVTADATVEAAQYASLALGTVTHKAGLLTTQGMLYGQPIPISFVGVDLSEADEVGYDPQTPTNYGAMNAGGKDVLVYKAGPSTWTMTSPIANLGAGSKFEVREGTFQPAAAHVLSDKPVEVLGGVLNPTADDALGSADLLTVTGGLATMKGAGPLGQLSDPKVVRAVNMNGGTFEITGDEVVVDNIIMGSLFQPVLPRNTDYNNETFTNLEGASYQPSGSRVFTGDKPGTVLTTAEVPGYNVRVTGSTQCDNNNEWGPFPTLTYDWEDLVTAYSGSFTPRLDGVHNFHWDNDDAGSMFLDLDRNGTFEASERVGVFAWNSNGNVDLEADVAYPAIYMAQEWGGGRNVSWRMTEPGGSEAIVNPSDGRGMWQAVGHGAINEPNLDFDVAEDSTIRAVTDISAAFGEVTLHNGKMLVTEGGPTTFVKLNIVTPKAVGGTGIMAPANVVTPLSYDDTGQTSTLVVAGTGTLVIDNTGAKAYSAAATTLEVRSGTLNGVGDRPLADAALLRLAGGRALLQGVTTTETRDDMLVHRGYNWNNDGQLRNLHDPAQSLMLQTPSGQALFVDGPGGRGLDYNDDWDFVNAGVGITDDGGYADNYMNLWLGELDVTPYGDGSYEFRIEREDDIGEFWIDLDRSGDFQQTEKIINDGNHGWVARALDVAGGPYMVAVGHREGGGGSNIRARIRAPGLTDRVIKPGDAEQTGLWSTGPWQVTLSDAFPADLDYPVEVVGDAVLEARTDGSATELGTLTLKEGAVLRTRGTPITFSAPVAKLGDTIIDPDAHRVAYDPGTLTDFGVVNGMSDAREDDVWFSKVGSGSHTFTGPNTNMEDVVFRVAEGRLTMKGMAPWGDAPKGMSTRMRLSGGTMEIKGIIAPYADSGPAGALAQWELDEDAESWTAADSTGNGYTGDVWITSSDPTGDFRPGQGVIGGAIELNGAADNIFVDHPGYSSAADINIDNKSFSTAFWSKPSVAGENYVLGQGDTGSTRGSLHIGYRDADTFTFAFWGDDLNYDNAGVVGDTDNYHHWACTYDAGAQEQKVYLDGRLVSTRGTGGHFASTGSNAFWIGKRQGGGNFRGLIDDVWVYADKVLTPEEVAGMAGSSVNDMTTHTVAVDGAATLEATDCLALDLGALTMEQGSDLATAGAPISFPQTIIDPATTAAGFRPNTSTTLDKVDGIEGNDASAVLSNYGPLDLVLDKSGHNLGNATFQSAGGNWVMIGSAPKGVNPPGAATLQPTSGEIVLTAADGSDSPLLYDNAVIGDGGGLTAGKGGQAGTADGPFTIQVGSTAKANGVSLPGDLYLKSTDGYTLELQGDVSGAGGMLVEDAGSDVRANASVSAGLMVVQDGKLNLTKPANGGYGGATAGSLVMTGGELETAADLNVTMGKVTGGTFTGISPGENQMVVSESLKIDTVKYSIADFPPKATFTAQGSDLLAQTDLTVPGGIMTITGKAPLGLAGLDIERTEDPDIPIIPGSYSGDAEAIQIVEGGGADVWDYEDDFHYAQKEFTGAGEIIAHVLDYQLTQGTGINGWAKFGVMIRDKLTPGSRQSFVSATPSNGVMRQGRITEDTNSLFNDWAGQGQTVPYWVRLVFDGTSNMNFYRSSDPGWMDPEMVNWEEIATARTDASYADENYIGLAVTSHDTADLMQARFDNVLITAGAVPDYEVVQRTTNLTVTGNSEFGGGPGVSAVGLGDLDIQEGVSEVVFTVPVSFVNITTPSDAAKAPLETVGNVELLRELNLGGKTTYAYPPAVLPDDLPDRPVTSYATLLHVGNFTLLPATEEAEGAVYNAEIVGSDPESIVYPAEGRPYYDESGYINDKLSVESGDATLGGTLKLEVHDKLGPRFALDPDEEPPTMVDFYGFQTRTLVEINPPESGLVVGTFQAVPEAQPEEWYIVDVIDEDTGELLHARNWEQGHLRYGVFLTRQGNTPAQPGMTYEANVVQANLFQAANGDTNGDRLLESKDVQNILGFGQYLTGVPCDWPQGDFNGSDDPDDPELPPGAAESIGLCNSYDIQLLLATALWPPTDPPTPYVDLPGPKLADGEARLLVRPLADGTFSLRIDTGGLELNSFAIRSADGALNGEDAVELGLFTADDDFAIAGAGLSTLIEGVYDLGAVGGPGLDGVGGLSLTYTVQGAAGLYQGEVVMIPEPGTVAMLIAGGLGLLWLAIRRRRRTA